MDKTFAELVFQRVKHGPPHARLERSSHLCVKSGELFLSYVSVEMGLSQSAPHFVGKVI